MSSAEITPTPPTARRRRLWLWCIGGFITTFILIAVSSTTMIMVRVGDKFGVAPIKLWRFYLREWPRAFEPVNLGSASTNQSILLTATAQHLLLSAGGAAAFLIIGWLRRRLKDRSRVP